MSRTRPLHRGLALLAALTLVAAACGSDEGSSSGGSSAGDGVLRTAFYADMQVPDPDIFYEVEGSQVITGVYDGLVRYVDDGSTTIEGALAESYEVSDDELTYTFTLRDGATFHDGTTVDSAAAQFSFERRTTVNSAPAYMLADVDHYETPDASTFVVVLTQPVAAFLDYMASPYGPKLVSPALVEANEVDGDSAQEWMQTHDAGSGPFTISEFSLGQQYVLDRYDDYWAGTPGYEQVVISIIPDAATQQVQLEGGDLDIVHQQPIATIESFRDRDGYQVVGFPVVQKTFLHVNEHTGPFQDKALRQALGAAIDRESIVEDVYQGVAEVSTQIYPKGMIDESLALDEYDYDPSSLEGLVAGLDSGDRSITLTYAIGSINDQRIAETLQKTLSDVGLDVTIDPKTTSQIFDMVNQDPTTLPDLLLETANPDAAHPDTWIRIFMRTGGALNYLQASTPEADAEMDRGLHLTDDAAVAEAYGNAGDLIHEDATFITIDDIVDTFIASDSVSGITHSLPMPFTIRLDKVEPAG